MDEDTLCCFPQVTESMLGLLCVCVFSPADCGGRPPLPRAFPQHLLILHVRHMLLGHSSNSDVVTLPTKLLCTHIMLAPGLTLCDFGGRCTAYAIRICPQENISVPYHLLGTMSSVRSK